MRPKPVKVSDAVAFCLEAVRRFVSITHSKKAFGNMRIVSVMISASARLLLCCVSYRIDALLFLLIVAFSDSLRYAYYKEFY